MPSRFVVGSWMVDPTSNEVSRGSDVRRLEAKVMQVLVVLAARAGEAVSRDQLIEAVWPHVVVTDSTLTRCVSQLRRALDDDARGPALIETIPKVGYRLASDVLEPASPPERPASEREKTIQGASTRILRSRRTGLVALVIAFALGISSLLTPETPPTPPRPITSSPGAERGVSFSRARPAGSAETASTATPSARTDLQAFCLCRLSTILSLPTSEMGR